MLLSGATPLPILQASGCRSLRPCSSSLSRLTRWCRLQRRVLPWRRGNCAGWSCHSLHRACASTGAAVIACCWKAAAPRPQLLTLPDPCSFLSATPRLMRPAPRRKGRASAALSEPTCAPGKWAITQAPGELQKPSCGTTAPKGCPPTRLNLTAGQKCSRCGVMQAGCAVRDSVGASHRVHGSGRCILCLALAPGGVPRTSCTAPNCQPNCHPTACRCPCRC